MAPDGSVVSKIEDYVPDLVPGSYGDYVTLDIDQYGRITNWERPERGSDFRGFFGKDDE